VIHPEAPAPKDAAAFDDVARRSAAELPALVDEWKDLVKKTGRERTPNHVELVESHLGEMPDPEKHPARLACYVAGLINPIPGMGVAYEIRPALLCAVTVSDMIGVVHGGITSSIRGLKKSAGLDVEDDDVDPE
jgi:hypothetical protein